MPLGRSCLPERQSPAAAAFRPPSVCTSGETVAVGTLPDGPVSCRVLEPRLKVCLVVPPRHAIHPGSGLAPERVERRPQRVDIDMVEERGEPFLLPLPCGLPYAVQRLGHASPALCPVRALLVRVPLGPRPWLHRLRRRLPGFVRRLHSYYAGVRLLLPVHHRLRLLAFPMRTGAADAARPGKRSPRFRRVPFVRDVALDPGRATVPRITVPHMLPSTSMTVSAPANFYHFVAQSHTPHDCCVRFAVVVTFHAATLATGRALPLTRAGLSPAGTRQLLLAHHR